MGRKAQIKKKGGEKMVTASYEDDLIQEAIDKSLTPAINKRLKDLTPEQQSVIDFAVEKRLKAIIDLRAQDRMDEPEVQQKIQELVDRYTEGRADSATAVRERLLEQQHAASGELKELEDTRNKIKATVREVRTLQTTEAAIRKNEALRKDGIHPPFIAESVEPKVMKYGEFGLCLLMRAITGLDITSEFVDFGVLSSSVETLLSQHTHRERTVIEERFGLIDGQRHTYEEVGKMFNVTRERIRQQEAKLLRIFRHPTRSRILRAALFERSTTAAIQEIRSGIQGLADEINSLLEAVSKIVRAAEKNSALVWEKASTMPDEIYNTNVDSHIKLSARASNALVRLNIKTIGELTTKTEKQLLMMRAFGVSSLAEVKRALMMVGLSLSEEH